jgi:U3 small nucleolar RNA-associated protein MPP10
MCFRLDEAGICEENEAAGTKSSLEMRQERLRMRLNQLEEQALAEKPWQLKGEVCASTRPHNSLLEEMLEFDLTTRAGEKVRGSEPRVGMQKCATILLVAQLRI